MGIPCRSASCKHSKRSCKWRTRSRRKSAGHRQRGTHEMTRSRDKVIDLVRVHLGSPSEAPEVPHAAADRETAGGGPQDQRFAGFASLDEPDQPASQISSYTSVPWPFFALKYRASRPCGSPACRFTATATGAASTRMVARCKHFCSETSSRSTSVESPSGPYWEESSRACALRSSCRS